MPNQDDLPLTTEWERELLGITPDQARINYGLTLSDPLTAVYSTTTHTVTWNIEGIHRAGAQLNAVLNRVHEQARDSINEIPASRWDDDGGFINERLDEMTEPEEELFTCEGCGIVGNDEVVYQREDDGLRCNGCNYQCDRCSTDMPEERMTNDSDENVCTGCERFCADCGNSEMATTLEQISHGWNESYLCQHCWVECHECGIIGPSEDMVDVGDYSYCESHTSWCGSCDESMVRDNGCENCGTDGTSGIGGYGHTSPVTWYGGPGGRYYLGIEHEVYMDYPCTAHHMKAWSAANAGEDFLHCKEDSSVQGYEIATQPMTPEFFESVNWEGYMETLNQNQPIKGSGGRARNTEPTTHGIHVHIGRVAFDRDEVAIAAFCYLIAQGNHLERIARREPYHYCAKVTRPVKVAISARNKSTAQFRRIMYTGDPVYAGRDAINLGNSKTIEIRAFASTRSANDLRNAVRVVYLAADYVNHLRKSKVGLSRKVLVWSEFARWVGQTMPEAFASIAGLEGVSEPSNKKRLTNMKW